MISKWGVSNFKSIATTRVVSEDGNETNDFIFKPLTILCGANSSGKSSLLQSLLLMAQTIRHQNKEIPLILNGAFTNLGKFDDIKSNICNNKEIQIRFSYNPSEFYMFTGKNYPFEYYDEFHECHEIIDSSFSIDFTKGENEILPKLSHFELSIHFDTYDDSLDILKYYNDGQSKNLCRLFYNTDEDSVNRDTKSLDIAKETKIEKNRVNSILPDEKYKHNHFLPENIRINGKHLINMMALNGIISAPFLATTLNSPVTIIEPDEARKYDFYYAKNMTKNLFLYLKNELLSDIQGIDNLFDLKGFKFIHDLQGYPYKSWMNNIFSLQISIQKQIADKFKYNFQNIYNKICDDLSNISVIIGNIIKTNENYFNEMSNDEDMEVKKCSICPFAYDCEREKTCFFYDHFIDADICCDLFNDDFIVSKNIEKFLSEISNYFSSDISYLGPLRDDPKLLYPITDSSYTNDINKKGENMAAILALNGEKSLIFPIPEWETSGICKTEEKSLKKTIIMWLKYIGIAEDIEAKIEQGGFSLKIKTPGSDHFSDLTNVGVGVSQVLPIVVMCLSAKEGATLIIEQPELHLHPKMQTKLTEFFIAISQSGRQCIIETHSEHIINALRHQVAKTKAPDDDKLANDIQIYFAEKDENGSLFRSITIDKYAYISEWPENFFDEAQITNINTLRAINRKLEEDPPSE